MPAGDDAGMFITVARIFGLVFQGLILDVKLPRTYRVFPLLTPNVCATRCRMPFVCLSVCLSHRSSGIFIVAIRVGLTRALILRRLCTRTLKAVNDFDVTFTTALILRHSCWQIMYIPARLGLDQSGARQTSTRR